MVSDDEIRKIGAEPVKIDNVHDIDCIIVMNNNPKYLDLGIEQFRGNSVTSIGFVDGWQLFNPKIIKKLGFEYRGIGIGIKNNAK